MLLLMSVVLMGVAAMALPVSRRLTGDLFTPASVIVASWCGALSLFLLRLLPYPPLHAQTCAFVAAVIGLLVAGMIGGQRLFDSRTRAASSGRGNATRDVAAGIGGPVGSDTGAALPHPDLWVIVFAAIGLSGTLWYAFSTAQVLGWRIFIDDPLQIRLALGSYKIPSQYLFLEYFCIVSPTLALAFALSGVRLRTLAWVLALLAVLATWVTTDRTHFFTLLLIGYFMALFQRGRALSWGRFAAVSAVAGCLLVGNFLLVGAWLGKTPANLNLTMNLPGKADVPDRTANGNGHSTDEHRSSSDDKTRGPDARDEHTGAPEGRIARMVHRALQRGSTLYLYSTGSFAALDVLLRANRPRSHGLHTFYPFGRALERLGLIEGPMPAAIAPFLPLGLTSGPEQPFNVYTFMFYPIEDFGPGGALIYALAIGLLSGVTFAYARRHRSEPVALLLIGHLYSALLLSIFVNKFNNTASWYILCWSLCPFLVARRQSRRRSSNQR
jgi:hypothetical protein